jgi:hypothetical protein
MPKPDEAALRNRFAELLPKLADDEFTVREQATDAIRELGPKVLEFLKELKTDDPEVAARLAHVRAQLSPRPLPRQPPKVSPEQQRALRHAKTVRSAKLVADADTKLRTGKTSHDLSKVLVDGDKQVLPVLRISFPAPRHD